MRNDRLHQQGRPAEVTPALRRTPGEACRAAGSSRRKGDDWQWLTDALEQIKRESGDPGVTVAIERAACPHCPCTYTTECCYCDGSRTELEDS